MATLEEIVVQLTAEVSGLKAGMSEASKAVSGATDKMDKAIEEFSKNSSKNTNFFQTTIATMAGFLGSQAVLGAFNAVKAAVGFLAGELQEGAKAAMAEEQALKQLANSLALSGQYTKEAMTSLTAFTNAMERETGVSDDVVAANLAVLSSITKLDSEGLQKAQKAAIDLSVALGKDLGSTTQMIARGIEGNTAAFSKMGITVEEGGTKAERLNNILKALANTQGAASGATDTFAGAAKKLENSYGNLIEQFSKAIVQNPVIVAGIKAIADILDGLTKSAEDSGNGLRYGVAEAFIEITEAISAALRVVDSFFKMLKGSIDAAQAPLIALTDAAIGIYEKFAGIENEDPFKATKENWEELTNTFSEDSTLSKVADAVDQVGAKAGESFGKLGEEAKTIAPSVDPAISKVQELTAAEQRHIDTVKAFSEELLKQGELMSSQYSFQNDLYKEMLDAKNIDETTYYELRAENLANAQAAEMAMLEEARATTLQNEADYQNAKTALAQKQTLESLKLENEKNKQRESNFKSTLDTISTLQSSSSKELAAIGKAAAIYQATVDGYAAVQKALASAPPPFNFALAAAVGVATAQNVAKIAGTGLAKGIDEVPGIGNADNFPAVLAPGERVVPKETNQDLTKFLENVGTAAGQQEITVRIEFIGEAAELIEAKILERQKLGISLLGAPLGAT